MIKKPRQPTTDYRIVIPGRNLKVCPTCHQVVGDYPGRRMKELREHFSWTMQDVSKRHGPSTAQQGRIERDPLQAIGQHSIDQYATCYDVESEDIQAYMEGRMPKNEIADLVNR